MHVDFTSKMFTQLINVPSGVDIVFVADMFATDYVGGAELTTEALINASPFKIFKLHAKDVSMQLLEEGLEKFWIFGNFSQLDLDLIPSIVANLRYSVLEYDYKYCKYRSAEKHASIENTPCNCHNETSGKLISAMYFGAQSLWWMSEKQLDKYLTLFPFLAEKNNVVLSSVFDDQFFAAVKLLRANKTKTSQCSGKWIVLGSPSWIKGTENAVQWCTQNAKDHEVVWNLPYTNLLEKLANARGLVYLPNGGDTCPRMVIEAKLLGCDLVLNQHVQHSNEEWFNTDDIGSIEEYLYSARTRFWDGIKCHVKKISTVSGYTTTLNCIAQTYPFEECIKSMLGFCDEVCVVDGGSTDGTIQRLNELTQKHTNLKVKIVNRDWNSKHRALYDGMQKAEARKMCTSDLLWQMDSDEVVHEDDFIKIKKLASVFPNTALIVSLPVIEFWGSTDKIRLDIQPWKWRLSKNHPRITHGIPAHLRKFSSTGELYALPGTDGCDMIDSETGAPLPHATFFSQEHEQLRIIALTSKSPHSAYQDWFNEAVNNLPSVFHWSWLDIERKIRLYRDYWTSHWITLTGKEYKDTPHTNMMFDCAWSDVTDKMISKRAKELSKTGGWIFHSKWNGEMTPWLKLNRKPPQTPQCLRPMSG